MKNDVIYFNGCSFTYGIGIDELESECITLRFSKTLADRLGYVELNKSVPGSCNQRIARRTTLDLLKHKPKFAIIVWSDPARFEFIDASHSNYKWEEDAEQVRPTSVYAYPRRKTDGFLQYYKHVASPQRDTLYTLQNMIAVKNVAELVGTKCIQMQFRSEMYASISRCFKSSNTNFIDTVFDSLDILSNDDLIIGLRDDTSFFKICGAYEDKSVLSKFKNQEGHPNKESHDRYADWLYDFMKDKNLV